MTTKPIPDAYRTAMPYFIVNHAASAIEFYKKAFGATERVRLVDPTGKVMHAEIRIGNSPLMLADEFPDMGYRSPQSLGGSPVSILLYVEDVDTLFRQAVAAGAKENNGGCRPIRWRPPRHTDRSIWARLVIGDQN